MRFFARLITPEKKFAATLPFSGFPKKISLYFVLNTDFQ